MVLAVPPRRSGRSCEQLCAAEDVEATVIGRFEPTGRLVLKYQGKTVGDLSMQFLHDGRPPVVRQATSSRGRASRIRRLDRPSDDLHATTCSRILGSLNVASKEWIIRQYDHEVQGGSVIKPLVGVANDGPCDAAVVRPVLGSRRGLAIACGMNPRYGDFDPYDMAAAPSTRRSATASPSAPTRRGSRSSTTSAGATASGPRRSARSSAPRWPAATWRSPRDAVHQRQGQPQQRVQLLRRRGAEADHRHPADAADQRHRPGRRRAPLRHDGPEGPGNLLYLVGETHERARRLALRAGERPRRRRRSPTVDPARAKATFAAMHRAIAAGLVAACHDLSEGGLAAAAAEMAFAGGLGAELQLDATSPQPSGLSPAALLFSESNTRFLCEVRRSTPRAFEMHARRRCRSRDVGVVRDDDRLIIAGDRAIGAADRRRHRRTQGSLATPAAILNPVSRDA